MRVKIENDVMDIASAVKGIDKEYYLAYNKATSKFELHHKECKPTLQLILPYEQLDYRTYLYVQRTRTARIMEEIVGIDAHNKGVDERVIKKATQDASEIITQ